MCKSCNFLTVGIGKYLILLLLLGVVNSYAQLSGTYTINPDGTGERNYTSFAAAITALNSGISSSVIFNVESGKTFAESPLTITATGTISNTITFQKSGGGANPIINFTGTSSFLDAGFQIQGSDYITFNGLNITDAGDGTPATGDDLEIGIYFKGLSTDGCQNNTVKNCVVDMRRTNINAWGVYVYSVAEASSGKNSNNKFYNNTVQDCFVGYYFRGVEQIYPDAGNEIGTIDGGTSLIDNIGADGGNFVFGVRLDFQQNAKVFNTTISNLAGNNSITGISQWEGSSSSGSYYNNVLRNFSLTLSTYSLAGISISNGAVNYIYGNEIDGLSSENGTVIGISLSASGATNHIYKNKIHNLNFSGISIDRVSGIATSAGTNYIYNNFIHDLRASKTQPKASWGVFANVMGVELKAGYNYVVNNSVLLNYTSEEALNESAALFISVSVSLVDLRNNIFVNNTNVTTGARAVSIYRDNTTYTNLSANSNNNIYYAGTPSAKNLIFYDRTNSDQTLEAYKTRMATKDQNSVTENVPFLSTSGTYNLHLNPATPTLAEGRALVVTTPFAVTDDIDGDLRSGTTPDIGADEGAFTAPDLSPPVVDWANLQFPQTANILVSGSANIYAQVYEPGVTDASGQGTGIQVWIGYSNSNTLPSTWSDWVAASYAGDQGNNDEYSASIGSSLSPGKYYYASRIKLNDGPYIYGGYNSGFWDGTTNVSGVLWITGNTIDGNLNESNYTQLATKQNSNSGFGADIDISKIVYSIDQTNNLLYLGFYGKIPTGNANGIGLWLDFSELTGVSSGVALGNNPGVSHYLGNTGNNDFKADFQVDFMLGLNSGSSSNCYVDIVKLVGGSTGSYLGNASINGTAVMGPSASGVFSKYGSLFSFNNSAGEKTGFEIVIPFSELGVTSVGTISAFGVVVSSTGFFSDVTVPGNIVTEANPGFNADFSTLAGSPFHSAPSLLPVELSSFIHYLKGNAVDLKWSTKTEVNSYKFVIERSLKTEFAYGEGNQNALWEAVGEVNASGNSNSPKEYSFSDKNLADGKYSYRLKMIDNDGTFEYSPVVEVEILRPSTFDLRQNYPNPFNPVTQIQYQLPVNSQVKLMIYSITGELVTTLVDENQIAGNYTVPFDASALASGTYIYRLVAGDFVATKKMVVLK